MSLVPDPTNEAEAKAAYEFLESGADLSVDVVERVELSDLVVDLRQPTVLDFAASSEMLDRASDEMQILVALVFKHPHEWVPGGFTVHAQRGESPNIGDARRSLSESNTLLGSVWFFTDPEMASHDRTVECSLPVPLSTLTKSSGDMFVTLVPQTFTSPGDFQLTLTVHVELASSIVSD